MQLNKNQEAVDIIEQLSSMLKCGAEQVEDFSIDVTNGFSESGPFIPGAYRHIEHTGRRTLLIRLKLHDLRGEDGHA